MATTSFGRNIKNSYQTIKNTCENNKGNEKDCLLRKAWSSINGLNNFLETHNVNGSLNHYVESFEANKRLF